MTKFINCAVTIGWVIDEISKMKWVSLSGTAIFDDTQHLGPVDYYLMHHRFPPLLVYDLENLRPEAINAVFTKNTEQLWNLTREEEFFKKGSSYIFVTAIDKMEIDAFFREIWNKYRISLLFAINCSSDEVFFFKAAFNSTIVQAVDQLDQLDLDFSWHRGTPRFEGNPFRVVYFRREESFVVDEGLNIIGGQDALVMKTIAEKFNATVELVETSDGGRYGQRGPNGTIQGAFKNVLQGSADITGNTHFLKFYDVGGLHFTHYLSSDRLCLLVPKPKKIPNYVALFEKVQYRWFYMYVASCIFGLVTIRRVENLLNRGVGEMNMNIMISVVFRIFLGVPVLYQFNKVHEKIIISSFLLAAVVISNYFQCTMTTIASSPSYEKTMNTLSDVRYNGIPIIYSNNDVRSYLSNEDLKWLNFKEVSVEQSIAAAKRSDIGRTHRTYSVFIKKNMYYKGVKASKSMHIVPECLVDYPLAFVVADGNPFLEPINRVMSQIVESGLYLKWTTDSVPANTYIEKNRKESSMPDPVKNYELYYAYAQLGVGLSISFVAFVAEKIMHHKNLKTQVDDEINSKKHFRFIQ